MTSPKIVVTALLPLLLLAILPRQANANRILDQYRADYIASFSSENMSALVPYLADDVRLMPEFYPTVWGKENVTDYFAALFERFEVIDYQREKTEVLELQRFIAESGKFTLKMRNKDGTPRTLTGKYMNLWERSDAGAIKQIADIWNYNHHIDFTDELKLTSVPGRVMAHESHLPFDTPATFELAAYNTLATEMIAQRRGDVWAMFYSDDAILMPHHQPSVKGRANLDHYFTDHAKDLPAFEKLHTRNDRVEDLGEFVIEFSNGSASWAMGAYSGVSTGKHIRIWRREAHGGLRIYRAILAYDQ